MITIRGNGVLAGFAEGTLHFYHRKNGTVTKKQVENISAEHEILDRALRLAAEQIRQLAKSNHAEEGEAISLLESHAMLAEDLTFAREIHTRIEEEGCNASYAVRAVGEAYAAMFEAMEDSYMKNRALDMRDVTRQILGCLREASVRSASPDIPDAKISSEKEELQNLPETPFILAADELTPSEVIRLDKENVRGILIRGGSSNSHAAILIRAGGIPAIFGLGEELKEEYEGKYVYIDGEDGSMILEPDAETLEKIKEKRGKHLSSRHSRDDSQDACALSVFGNINFPEEAESVLAKGGQGIGLFRTEFLYLKNQRHPSEEEQFQAYRTVVETMKGKPVIIRTMDLGGDKRVNDFPENKEKNPALGMRGVRFSLSHPEEFRTQLRAIYRASAFGNVSILFPMIASVWEVKECKHICNQVMDELDREGISYRKETEIGIMLETPAAVFMADELAKEVDFFSVGTNDLTQYMLACDRQSNDLEQYSDPRHPAVLRALKMASDAAHRAGIRIGICGELAADPDMLPAFLAMGIDEISVSLHSEDILDRLKTVKYNKISFAR